MKVTINKTQRKYPWVGQCDDSVVLFLGVNEAILLQGIDEELLGVIDNEWIEGEFTPCSITLDSTEDGL